MQSFNTNGTTLHYEVMGKGRPLLFIPGSISDYRTWTNIRSHFADTYECYVVSRRFQYPSKYSSGGDSSVAINTADIAAFIKDKNISPAIVIGHSFGGFIALNLAIQHPELVQSVVAEEAIFAPALVRNPKNPLELLALLFRSYKAGKSFARLGIKGIDPTFKALAKGDVLTAQKTFIDGVTGGKKTPDTLDKLTQQQLVDNIAALAGEDPFINTITMDSVAKIQCPVLLLSGTESPYVFHYINQRLRERIRSSTLVTFSGAGHWIHIEQAEKFIATINNHLRLSNSAE